MYFICRKIMKILFIYEHEYLEPLGIMSLSSFLKKSGHQTFFFDLKLEKNHLTKIEKMRPDIIAYSITTGKHQYYQKINCELKKRFRFYSVFGGPHATFFPEFICEDGVDAVCIGEGEYPLLELADNLKDKKDHSHIRNLWIKNNGMIYKNELRPLIEDLDILPFADRGLVNKYSKYRNLHRRNVITGRGCPYNCSYCFNHAYRDIYKNKGKQIRRRSPDNVIEELKLIKKECKPNKIHFVDDIFVMDQKWCIDLLKRYKKEIDLPFIAYVRVNHITDELASNLKDAGCITIVYAIESGNDHIRNTVLERNMSDNDIEEAVKIFKKYKLRTYSQNMLGVPDETLDMALETVEFNKKCKPDYAWCSIFQPYPRTKLWGYCLEKGYLSDEEYSDNFYKGSILKIKNKKEIVNLHHLFSIAVAFSIPQKLLRLLIKLPVGKFYYLLWNAHRIWCYIFKVKWLDISEILKMVFNKKL
jgi:anaerobic magnesium-protoporphyrin IX monomethyl ester cyclase